MRFTYVCLPYSDFGMAAEVFLHHGDHVRCVYLEVILASQRTVSVRWAPQKRRKKIVLNTLTDAAGEVILTRCGLS